MLNSIITKLALVLIIASSITINADAQCYLDRHNTSWNDAWTSCEATLSPNPNRDAGHWIMYNFGQDYALKASHIWNLNDPKNLESGIKEFEIDYSYDGVNWIQFGKFDIPKATGSSTYQGVEGPDLNGIIAQYVLITAISNHGGILGDESGCYGLSEIKFEFDNDYVSATDDLSPNFNYCLTAKLSPNPAVGDTQLSIKSNCSNSISYQVVDALGKLVLEQKEIRVSNDGSESMHIINSDKLRQGIYFVEVYNGQHKQSLKLIKLKI